MRRRFRISDVNSPGSTGYGYGYLFVQAEDGIRGLVRSRGLGDVYKRQVLFISQEITPYLAETKLSKIGRYLPQGIQAVSYTHLTLPTSYSV